MGIISSCTKDDRIWSSGSRSGVRPGKRQDLSSSRELSIVRSHLFPDPVPAAARGRHRASSVAPDTCNIECRKNFTISGLNSKAFELAVYASQHRLVSDDLAPENGCPPPRKTRSRRLAALPDGLNPQETLRMVSNMSTYIISSILRTS